MVIQPGGTPVGGSATGTSSAAIAIPPLSSGANPKWVHVATTGVASGGVVIHFGAAAIGAATLTNGISVQSGSQGLIVNVAGSAYYRVRSGTGTVGYSIVPLAGIVPGG
tara:strand:+ start:149 stop:475 length:327 start_codon:yes stop_codon:yes gene_type:complete